MKSSENYVIKKIKEEFYFISENELNKFTNVIKNEHLLNSDETILNIKNEIFNFLNKEFNSNKFIFYFKQYYKNNSTLSGIEHFNLYLNKTDYFPNFDECVKVINITQDILIPIIENNLDDIKGENYNFLDNNFLLSLIKIYCSINKLNEINEIEIGNFINDNYSAYFKEVEKYPLLTSIEEKQLFESFNNGDMTAKEKLIKSNLKLVILIAKHYKNNNMDFLDLIQEGNIGLITAIERFDITKGYRFSTYAVHWIRQTITRAIANKSRNIRIPVGVHNNIIKYNQALELLSIKLNRKPTDEEIANELNLDVRQIKRIIRLKEDCVSLNTKTGDEEDCELENFIPSDKQTPEEIFMNEKMIIDVRNFLENANLTCQEKIVIKLRFGFNCDPLTMEKTGEILGVTRERVRQIEKKALKKLRRSSNKVDDLAVYLTSPEQSLNNLKEARKNNYEMESGLTNYIRSQVVIGTSPSLSIENEMDNSNIKILKK